ncbi:hypothetical protein [Candidatus Manganitrophus noduliformans]|uniref:Uncharacterized protein n=1 Tax=Candidatus Manganitrophus noduliformans TaxID=2606439 RepID=A0A7X6DS66_9BACT|nr:hypothetical protein [Candidatus Manganitrophus noduliformans]NKE72407.1 hypothetical protein [Candidatus Manganitrophus noduliformans]
MAVASLNEIYTAVRLVGFWQFTAGGQNYLGVLEQDADETRSTLTILRAGDGRWETVKAISDEDVGIRAIDGQPIGGDLLFGLELNEEMSLQIARVELSALLDPANQAVAFNPSGEISPTDAQAQKVDLPVTQRWNVATPLPPARWLFSPQFVRGGDAPQLIANTADGQAMLFTPTAQPDLAAFSIPNAAEPQAAIVNGQQIVAFKRYPEPYYPFWSLPQYSGDKLPKGGDLMVATDPASPRNLSRELSIGPIIGYKMAASSDGRLWIFALSDAPVGTDVIALSQRGPEWTVAGRWSVDGEVQQLSAEYATERWHLIYGVPIEGGWSLRHQTWRAA